ncbi:MAG: hypothetical protein HC933_00555 [Pleurocapsa sp. SU_196_0]|nr:hypothetical protein [Pleurocapsa sp. SU_196_0]
MRHESLLMALSRALNASSGTQINRGFSEEETRFWWRSLPIRRASSRI